MSGTSQTVTLCWPPAILLPNHKSHWKDKALAVKGQRQLAHWECKIARLARMTGPVGVHMFFYPPDRRRRDEDGMISSLKAALDGVSDAIGVDDHLFRLSHTVGDIIKRGRVVVTLKSMEG